MLILCRLPSQRVGLGYSFEDDLLAFRTYNFFLTWHSGIRSLIGTEGKRLILDDTLEHEAPNHSTEDRTVVLAEMPV